LGLDANKPSPLLFVQTPDTSVAAPLTPLLTPTPFTPLLTPMLAPFYEMPSSAIIEARKAMQASTILNIRKDFRTQRNMLTSFASESPY
jgi:hypothetical protein